MIKRLFFIAAVLSVLTAELYGQAEVDKATFNHIKPQGGESFNGDLNLSIPVVTVPGRDGLDFPIVLNYHRDTRASRKATWVGLDWSLNLGNVTRSVNNVPDDQSSNLFAPHPPSGMGKYNMWADFNTVGATELNGAILGSSCDAFDSYYLSFAEGAHRLVPIQMNEHVVFQTDRWQAWNIFWSGRRWSGGPHGYYLNWNDPSSLSEFVQAWKVTKEDGNEYLFDHVNNVEIQSSLTGGPFGIMAGGSHLVFPASWDLTVVRSPNYVDLNHNGDYDQEDAGGWVKISYNDYANSTYNPSNQRIDLGYATCDVGSLGRVAIGTTDFFGNSKRATFGNNSCTVATYPGSLKYDYSAPACIETPTYYAVFQVSDRADFLDGSGRRAKKLDSITLYRKLGPSDQWTRPENRISKITFQYAYSNSNLVLLAVQQFGKTDGDSYPPYKFDYLANDNFSITYPEGGSVRYEFENDSFKWYTTLYNDGIQSGVHPLISSPENFRTYYLSSAVDAESVGTVSYWEDGRIDCSDRILRMIVKPTPIDSSVYCYNYGDGVLSNPILASDQDVTSNMLSFCHNGSVGYRWVETVFPDNTKKRVYYTSGVSTYYLRYQNCPPPSENPQRDESYPDLGASSFGRVYFESNAAAHGLPWKELSIGTSGQTTKSVEYGYPELDVDLSHIPSILYNTADRAQMYFDDPTHRYISDGTYISDCASVYYLPPYIQSFYRDRFLTEISKSVWLPKHGEHVHLDGIESGATYNYSKDNGLLIEKGEGRGSGLEDLRTTRTTYAYEKYQGMSSKHMLSQVYSSETGNQMQVCSQYSYGGLQIPGWSCADSNGTLSLNALQSEQWCQLPDRHHSFNVTFNVSVISSNQGGIGLFFSTHLGNANRISYPPTMSYPDSVLHGYLLFLRSGGPHPAGQAKSGVYYFCTCFGGEYYANTHYPIDGTGTGWRRYYARPTAGTGFDSSTTFALGTTHSVRVVREYAYNTYVPIRIYVDNRLFYTEDSTCHGSAMGVIAYHANANYQLNLDPIVVATDRMFQRSVEFATWAPDSLGRWLPYQTYKWLRDSTGAVWQGESDAKNMLVSTKRFDKFGNLSTDVDANGFATEYLYDKSRLAPVAQVRNSSAATRDTIVTRTTYLVDPADTPVLQDDFEDGSELRTIDWRISSSGVNVQGGKMVLDAGATPNTERFAVMRNMPPELLAHDFMLKFDFTLRGAGRCFGLAILDKDNCVSNLVNADGWAVTNEYTCVPYCDDVCHAGYLTDFGSAPWTDSYIYYLHPSSNTYSWEHFWGSPDRRRQLFADTTFHAEISMKIDTTIRSRWYLVRVYSAIDPLAIYQMCYYYSYYDDLLQTPSNNAVPIFFVHDTRAEIDNVQLYAANQPDLQDRYITIADTTITARSQSFADDFEQGLDKWPIGTGTITCYGATGRFSLNLPFSGNARSTSPIPVVPNTQYLLSTLVSGQNLTSNNSTRIDFLDASNAVIQSNTQIVGSGSFPWLYHENKATSPSGARFARLTLAQDSGSGSSYFDDVRFFPAKGLMKTWAYDSLSARVISKAVESGVPTRYGFDNFWRLSSISDPWGKTLRQYAYEYSRKASNGYLYDQSNPNMIQENLFSDATTKTVRRSFFDGLGLQVQQQTELGSDDIISATLYDKLFRPMKTYKTYQWNLGSNAHKYDPNFFTNDSSYYQPLEPGVGNYPFSETAYTSDGLGRVASQGSPGAAFQPFWGRDTRFSYSANVASDVQGYGDSLLYKTVRLDETGKQTQTFTDLFGKTVSTVVDPGGLRLQTLHKYDVMDNLISSKAPRGDETKYTYNSLGQVTSKCSPDGGTVRYRHDKNGNLRFEQNANNAALGKFVYMKWDALNRNVEVGEFTGSFSAADSTTTGAPANDFPAYGLSGRSPRIKNTYDLAATGNPTLDAARNLRGRLFSQASGPGSGQFEYTYYSYDDFGRVEWMVQWLFSQSLKKISYTYDWQGGVTKTGYEDLSYPSNNMYFTYEYDAAGRLSRVFSTPNADGSSKTKEAEYTYFANSQVKRLQLGNAQGMDFGYNERDWLAQINHQNFGGIYQGQPQDPGRDGTNGLPVDAFAEVLGYHTQAHIASGTGFTFHPQYNGNVSWAITRTRGIGLPGVNAGYLDPMIGNVFEYDNADRLTKSDFGYYNGPADHWSNSDPKAAMYELPAIGYDANGNIRSLLRNGQSATLVDSFTYNYGTANNRLQSIRNGVGGGIYTYTYDANGNVTSDQSRNISSIAYDHRNLPTQANFSDGRLPLYFRYDANGKRVCKIDAAGDFSYYILGANGETMAVYDQLGKLKFWNIWANGQMIGKITPY